MVWAIEGHLERGEGFESRFVLLGIVGGSRKTFGAAPCARVAAIASWAKRAELVELRPEGASKSESKRCALALETGFASRRQSLRRHEKLPLVGRAARDETK